MFRRTPGLDPIDVARKVVDIAADKQATDILLLDIRPVSILADYFVICTAASERQTKAILDEVAEQLKKDGERPLHEEGASDSGWVLLDYGAVIVHVFSSDMRAFYGIEKLWSGAVTVLHLQ